MRRVTAALVLATMLAAPPTARAADETIAAFSKNQVDPHFEGLRIGVDQAAAALGATVRHYVPTRPNNIAEATSQLEDVVAAHPAAALFMAVDARAQLPGVQRLIASGVPVVNYNDRAGDAPFVSYVGQDDFALGKAIALHLFDHLGGRGGVVILEGVRGSTTGDDRRRGFEAAARERPGIRILASQPANFQRLPALQAMENIMQRYPRIDGVIAAADAMALGAVEALAAAGRANVPVVSINGVPEAVEAVRDGRILAIAEFNGFRIGCVAANLAIRHLRGENVPREVLLPGAIITRANMAEWLVPFAQRRCPPPIPAT
ncbi:sugar ABC transporter substrate-binding protein [Roseomonas sp. NAR14]|uniref:Sugar ABC transporter substrate-binding protein n=1 Tax=Roseomonas acroporae TaxID=2937791 RepID=A0A9X2BXL0_9PROT|nr:sugar ABC transporter substrate-binding protein [Roseomonas acroporae]MCK8786074.1 sugar ABC transporter substrate-binding protein [Roseomonas acroporae]